MGMSADGAAPTIIGSTSTSNSTSNSNSNSWDKERPRHDRPCWPRCHAGLVQPLEVQQAAVGYDPVSKVQQLGTSWLGAGGGTPSTDRRIILPGLKLV
jgi:hypothetical protein